MDLISKLRDIQSITLSVFELMLLTTKKILIIQDNFLASIAHASSKKVGEKAFFKENENKLVKLFYFEETWKNGEIQEHVFPWTRDWRLKTLYICKLYILHVWVLTASAIYHFLCCVHLFTKMLLSTLVIFWVTFRGNTVSRLWKVVSGSLRQ